MLGILIGDIRNSLGISQEELAAGICKRGALRKYESGANEPEKLLADALMQRLGKTMDKYYIRLDAGEYKLAMQRTWIQVYLRRGKLVQAARVIRQYGELPGTDHALHRQFLALSRGELLRREGASLQEQQTIVREGLCETFGRSELSTGLLKDRLFHLLELLLLQRHAILLEETGETEEAVGWYEALLERFSREDRGTADMQRLYPLIAYRLAKYRMGKEQFDEALMIIHSAKKLLQYSGIRNVLYVMLGELEFAVKEGAGYPVLEKEKEQLRCIREIMGRYEQRWHENYYPAYLEPYIGCVSEILKDRRKAFGMSREELAFGVCDPRTLERIEKGDTKVQRRVREGLFQKLGLSIRKYDGGIATDNYGDYRRLENMVRAYAGGELKEAEQLYKTLLEQMNLQDVSNWQFEEYWGTLLRFRKGELTRKERNERLWVLLGRTLPLNNREKSFRCWLTEYERAALCSIAWDCEEEEMEELLPILRGQLHRNRSAAKQMAGAGFYGEMLYCIARGYLKTGDVIHASLFISLEAERMCFDDWGGSWERILFLKFQVEEKRLRLQEKETPLENNADVFEWAKKAWVMAKENCNRMMCDFMRSYFKQYYRLDEEFPG